MDMSKELDVNIIHTVTKSNDVELRIDEKDENKDYIIAIRPKER
jgi:hypothetical protein